MYCRASYSTIFDRHNNPAYAIISIENVTSLRKIELAYERWRQSLSAIPKSGYLLMEQNITNGAYENIEGDLLARFPDTEGLPVQDFIGYMTKRSISGTNGPSDWQLRRGYLLEAFNKGKRSFDTEFQMLDINGHPVWLSLNVQTVGHSDRDEVKAFFLCRDIDREKRHEIALMTKAEIDELTGIYNRHTFISKVEDIIDESKGEKHAIIIMDLDNFKSVNDTYGHDVGDRVLSEASKLLRSFLRSSDILGRIGGDEFMVCMRNVTDVQLLNRRAQIMCQMFEKQWKDNFNVTVSAGIALFPADGNNFEDLYKHADIAMYAAKQRGRNQFAFYSSSLPNDAMCPGTIESGENTCVFSKPEFEKVSNILKVNDMLIKQQEAYERYKMAFEHTNTVMFECNLLNSSFFAPRQMKEYALGISDIALMLSGDMPSDAVHRHDCDAVIRFMLQKLSGNSGRKDI
ncbi:MAG: GGDEF domain-containing protein, partial [Synergistaceae bacterium]